MRQGARPLEIGILIYPAAQLCAVYGLTDMFQVANRKSRERGVKRFPGFAVSHWHVGEDGRSVERRAAAPMVPAGPLAALLVPPCIDGTYYERPNPAIVAWIAHQHRRGAVICSACAGAFFLASAGLLDGRRATTHWNLTDRFKPLFPQVAIDEDQMVIDDGDVITTGGVMSWTQLGLRLIRRFASPAIATDVGRFFIVDAGGPPQSFYKSFAPRFDHGDQAIVKVQHWLQRSFGKKISVSAMSTHVNLEERTFLRRFYKATGFTPTTYLQQLRVESARDLLETTDLSIEQIVWRVGYDDSGSFRRLFQRTTGLAPREYRRRFSTGRLVA